MNKRVIIPLVTAVTFAFGVPMSTYAESSRLQILNQQIKEKEAIKSQEQKELNAINSKVVASENQLAAIQKQVANLKAQSRQAEKDQQAARERVKQREEIIKKRVTAMYEAGDEFYIDVLLGARSFGDFIERVEFLKLIIEQDTQILEENKRDIDLIEAKKKEIAQNLSSVQQKEAEYAKVARGLNAQKADQQRVVNKLKAQIHELNEAKQDEINAAMSVVNQGASQYSNSGSVKYTGGKFIWPVKGTITSYFGYRSDPFTGRSSYHDGLDIAAPGGTPIYAAASGTVTFAGTMNGYGNVVIIFHGNGVSSFYAHIRNGGIKVSKGQTVSQGQYIAQVGSTGRSTGNHCHFSVIKNGTKVDPMSYLR